MTMASDTARIDEVATDIFRINVVLPGSPLTFSFFLIRDEQPTLVETGFSRPFPMTLDAVTRLVDPAALRYIVIPHTESDESGALNQFLDVAPHAVPVGSPIGVVTNLSDLASREPMAVDETSLLDLGTHRLRFLITPYVHQWDSMLAWDETTRTLFSSDVFISPGDGPAVAGGDETDAMVAAYQQVGIFPSRAHLDAALDKIEAISPATLAAHHGSVKASAVPSYLATLREADVTGLTDWNPMA
jgi:flavorubredoxin